jgi:hypothetical protein
VSAKVANPRKEVQVVTDSQKQEIKNSGYAYLGAQGMEAKTAIIRKVWRQHGESGLQLLALAAETTPNYLAYIGNIGIIKKNNNRLRRGRKPIPAVITVHDQHELVAEVFGRNGMSCLSLGGNGNYQRGRGNKKAAGGSSIMGFAYDKRGLLLWPMILWLLPMLSMIYIVHAPQIAYVVSVLMLLWNQRMTVEKAVSCSY